MPTTSVVQTTCAVSNLGFIYIYGNNTYLPGNLNLYQEIDEVMSHN